MEIEPRILTPAKIVISSQSLLRLSGGTARTIINGSRWSLEDYLSRAANLGAELMYEPLRKGFSSARNEFESLTSDSPLLEKIAYLAEPAQSEIKIADYLNKRIIFQLIYGVLEESRFSPNMISAVTLAEQKIAQAHNTPAVPVRVYADRRHDGVVDALIFQQNLKNKVYAPSPEILTRAARDTADSPNQRLRSAQIVEKIQAECARYNVTGIELSLLRLTTLFQNDRALLHLVVADLLAANNPNNPKSALVQTVSIQPARIDFPGNNISYSQIEEAVAAVAEQQFRGTIIFSPGGGDPELEIRNVKNHFHL